jgi:hypothetical protein
MDIAVIVLTAALVLTTAVYAFFTWRMAEEMQRTRLQSIRPRVGLYLRPYSPMGGNLAIRSLGPGTALDVELAITFTPDDDSRRWRTPVFSPGEEAELFFPGLREGTAGFKDLEERQTKAEVRGFMKDVVGHSHAVDEHLDVAGWSKLTVGADQRYPGAALEDIPEEVKKIRQTLEKLYSVLQHRGT